MIQTIRRRHELRKAARGWAAEAIALYGDQAETAVGYDALDRSGMEAYAWHRVLIEIERLRSVSADEPEVVALTERLRQPLTPSFVLSEA